ncbi:MAG: hypothetical protein PHW34_16225 [Hespellia sp.]|nr:hypothetical protein [Hespellia sp.]
MGDAEHISEIRFDNESWTGSYFTVSFTQREFSGAEYTDRIETETLYLGQSKTVTFENISRGGIGYLPPTIQNGIRVDSTFNSDTCAQTWVLDPNANLRAKYRATGTEFNITLHYDGTEPVSSPVQPGEGDLKIENSCHVSTQHGLLQQVIIKENDHVCFSKTWDTHNESSVYHVGLKKDLNYSILLREAYNMAGPTDIPAFVYINSFINIMHCQAHDGTLKLIGTGFPTGKADYTFDYNGQHYDYSPTLNIDDK